jgi:hypothetical protein
MFDSPQERAEFMARYEANQRALEARIVKIKAELAAKRRPQSQP